MGILHQRNCGAESSFGTLAFERESLDRGRGGDALSPNSGLFLGEKLGGDVFGVVGVEQLALLTFQAHQIVGCALQFDRAAAGDLIESLPEILLGQSSLVLGQRDALVVALDGVLDRFGSVVWLAAGLGLPAGADEVLVEATVAAVLGIDQSSAAGGAVDRAAEVVEVSPAGGASDSLRIQYQLHLFEGCFVDQRFMSSGVNLAAIAHDAEVVIVAQDLLQPADPDHLRGCSPRRSGAEAALLEDRGEIRQRVVGGGVEREGGANVRSAVWVEHDGADLAQHVAAGAGLAVIGYPLATVEVAEWCFVGRAAALGLLDGALHDFVGEVLRVELGDRAHDAVQQQSARGLVNVL